MDQGDNRKRELRGPAATGPKSIHEALVAAFEQNSDPELQRAREMLRRLVTWSCSEDDIEDAVNHAVLQGWRKFDTALPADPPTPNRFYEKVLRNFLVDVKRRRHDTPGEKKGLEGGALFWCEYDVRYKGREPEDAVDCDAPGEGEPADPARMALDVLNRVAARHLESVAPRYRESRSTTWREMVAILDGTTSTHLLIAHEMASRNEPEAIRWVEVIRTALGVIHEAHVPEPCRASLRQFVIDHAENSLRLLVTAMLEDGVVEEAPASLIVASCADACECERALRHSPARKTAADAIAKRHSNLRKALLEEARQMALSAEERALFKLLLTHGANARRS